jgi:hypothetical protein
MRAGPIVSALTNKFGCRVVCIAGSVVASAGFALSSLSQTLDVLMLTYGVIGGKSNFRSLGMRSIVGTVRLTLACTAPGAKSCKMYHAKITNRNRSSDSDAVVGRCREA